MGTKEKARLALEMLELEMEVLSKEEQMDYMGGSSGASSAGSVTSYLSQFFGKPVTSSIDSGGNWQISIGGGNPIPLTFQLDDVEITAQGKPKYGGYEYGNWGSFFSSSAGNFNFSQYTSSNGSYTTTSNPRMPGDFAASSQLIAFMKEAELFKPQVYSNDGNNSSNPTIVYGHKLTLEEIANGKYTGVTMTEDESSALLASDLAIAVSSVNRNIRVPLTQQQFDALASFTYQSGPGNFANSNANTLINQGKYLEGADALKNYSNVSGDGRVIRRREEAELFSTGDYTFTH